MKLSRLRDKIQLPTLALAVTLFTLDWFSRVHYITFRESAYIDSTPPVMNQIWLLLLSLTLILGVIGLPRVTSFLALLSVLWVLFLSIQGH